VSEPECDHRAIHARLQKFHCRGMSPISESR
jgi:hypothetical protein